MRIHKLVLPMLIGSVLLSGTAYSQQIQTNTSATTQGSTQFGYLPSGADLGVFMQTTVAPTCTTVSTNVQSCTSDGGTAVGDNDNFVRVDQLPGSFTDSPIPGNIWVLPNFACGGNVASGAGCISLNSPIGGFGAIGTQTAPRRFGGQPLGTTNGTLNGRHALVNGVQSGTGTIFGPNVILGDGGVTPGMPTGFINTTLGINFMTFMTVSIDQDINQSIDLGAGSLMTVRTTTSGMVASSNGTRFAMPIGNGFNTNPSLLTTLSINQEAADGFGAMQLDSSALFMGIPASGNEWFPTSTTGLSDFVTPGLNTGIAPAAGVFDPSFGTAPCAPNTCFGFP